MKYILLILSISLLGQAIFASTPFERVDQDLAIYDQYIKDKKAEFNKTPRDEESKEWIRKNISFMYKIDQYMRNFSQTPYKNNYSQNESIYFNDKFSPRFSTLDIENTKELKELLNNNFWFTISEFGPQTNQQAWLLVQHADLDIPFQKEVLSRLKKLYPMDETNKSNYAYLYDRVRSIGERLPQLYGTQGKCTGPGEWEPHEIEDPKNVDIRRSSMNLVPMEEYKTWFKDLCH